MDYLNESDLLGLWNMCMVLLRSVARGVEGSRKVLTLVCCNYIDGAAWERTLSNYGNFPEPLRSPGCCPPHRCCLVATCSSQNSVFRETSKFGT